MVKLGSSFNFSWNYSGDLRSVTWGTKKRGETALNVTLFILDINGRSIPNVSEYNDRRLGSWNQQSPGQVIFTLISIKAVDNQAFVFKFVPNNPLASEEFDVVQLIVKGKSMMMLFHHGG